MDMENDKQDWIRTMCAINDGVMEEVGVDGEEVEEPREGCFALECCLKFTLGSASCFLQYYGNCFSI